MIKRLIRIWEYVTKWMPHGWGVDEMTEAFWEGD